MSKITVLDQATASKIAAGEVIERPAGVLKELLENAVDAGATAVNIDIEGAGKDLIRINDNGCGMDKEDLELSVVRHATSKIRTFDDLTHLHTFGFRGEALFSVAAVSRLTISSCTPQGEGHCIETQGGSITRRAPAPAIPGTTVEIRDLFFNTPARRKFLKSDSYERACLLKVVEESALANLRVSYRVRIGGREVYHLPAQTGPVEQAVRARAAEILGPAVAESLVFKEFKPLGLKLFLTPPDKLVTVRDFQFVFVNRRPIESKTVQQAVYKALQNVRPKDRHPAFIAYMTLEPADFDVNIHPQKREIRFVDENRVFGFILNSAAETAFGNSRPVEADVLPPAPAIDLSLQARPAAQQLFKPKAQEKTAPALPEFAPKPVEPAQPVTDIFAPVPNARFTVRDSEDPISYNASAGEPPARASQEALPSAQGPAWYKGPYHYLGQLQRSYLLFENPDGLILIDQHAAQERVLFEHYMDAFDKHDIKVQELMFPIHVDLTPSNAESLMSWAPWLKTAGFELERFSPRTVQVKTRPHIIRFKEDEMKSFVESLAAVVGDPAKSTDALKRKMVAMLACKKAVKAHDAMTAAEAQALLENMKKCKDGMHCPHGRACVAQLNIKNIGKLFGR